MRVLIVNTYYQGGGAERAARQLYEKLPEYGIDAFFFAGRYQDNLPQDICVAYRTFAERILSFLFGMAMRNQRLHSFIATKRIINYIQEKKIDVVHLNNIHSNFLGLRDISRINKECPNLVFTLHDMWMLTGGCAHAMECDKWKEAACRRCKGNPSMKSFAFSHMFFCEKEKVRNLHIKWVVPSEWLLKKCMSSGISEKRIQLIKNGISLEDYREKDVNKLKEKYGIEKNRYLLMFVANSINNVYKGYGYIREAIELLANKEEYAAIIVGGEEVSLPIKSYCFGYIKSDEIMSDLYNMADLFLLPSVADNYPYTPMEAMACGTPVVAFNTGGIPEIVRNDTGWIIENKSGQAIADCIEAIFSSEKQELHDKSKRCAEYARQTFGIDNMIREYIEIYKGLCIGKDA